MTHEQMIAGTWYSVRQIHAALGGSIDDARGLCDAITGGRANGGYGMNILNKVHPMNTPERKTAARRLAHSKLDSTRPDGLAISDRRDERLCSVCGY